MDQQKKKNNPRFTLTCVWRLEDTLNEDIIQKAQNTWLSLHVKPAPYKGLQMVYKLGYYLGYNVPCKSLIKLSTSYIIGCKFFTNYVNNQIINTF